MTDDNLPIEDDYGDGDIPPIDLPQQDKDKNNYEFL